MEYIKFFVPWTTLDKGIEILIEDNEELNANLEGEEGYVPYDPGDTFTSVANIDPRHIKVALDNFFLESNIGGLHELVTEFVDYNYSPSYTNFNHDEYFLVHFVVTAIVEVVSAQIVELTGDITGSTDYRTDGVTQLESGLVIGVAYEEEDVA